MSHNGTFPETKKVFQKGSAIVIEYATGNTIEQEAGVLIEWSPGHVTYKAIANGTINYVNLNSKVIMLIRTITPEEKKYYERVMQEDE